MEVFPGSPEIQSAPLGDGEDMVLLVDGNERDGCTAV